MKFFRTALLLNKCKQEKSHMTKCNIAQKKKFSIKDVFSKCDQIRRSHFLKKSLMENFIFYAMESNEGSSGLDITRCER